MNRHRKFTKEFAAEAVALLQSSGRTRLLVADDLGIGLSTLARWLRDSRDCVIGKPDANTNEDIVAELKRLRRENDVLRQERDILKKATFFRQGGKSMRFDLIDQAKTEFPIQRLCKALGVSQSGYFAWRERSASKRQRGDMVMLAHVRSAFSLSNGTYGSPRMTRELQDDGLAIGRRSTARLMRENGMQARQKRRFKRTTDSVHHWPVARNVIDQDFAATGPDEKWGVDISYIWTAQGWLYLAVILDLHSRRVLGWAVSDRMKKDLAIRALDMAVRLCNPPLGCLFHSDRGSQYCSIDYQAELCRHGIVISMPGKGNCYDCDNLHRLGGLTHVTIDCVSPC